MTAPQCQRLRELLIRSPYIVSSIKEVTFDIDIGPLDDCIGALDAMATILRFLKLEVLSLGAFSQNDKRDLPPVLCAAIAFSLSQPSISSLSLRCITLARIDFRNLFMHSQTLRHLSLSNVSCRPSDGEQSEGDLLSQPGIEEVVVELVDADILEWFGQAHCCGVNLTCLRSLTIVFDMDEARHGLINDMLRKAGPCLEDLSLRCVSGMSHLTCLSSCVDSREAERPLKDGICLNLACNPNLHSLRLNLAPNARYVASRCPPKWVLSTLEQFHSPVAIKELVLDIGIVDSMSFKRADYSRWRHMATALSRSSFPSLQCVRILATDYIVNLPLVEDLAIQAIKGLAVPWKIEITNNCESKVLGG
ncbi:hypothetical protein C0993_001053 [Termitomyces sp. T159_Od127]|nr:hypothetical protein C0993_001053 [Termitomyces sp. T159_Od127]